jgi:hypothetical protein
VAIFNPDQLDYDEELYQELRIRDKDLLRRFYNHHCDKIDERPIAESAHTQDALCKIIAAKFEEEIELFFERYKRLADESVRTDPSINYIAEHFDVSEESLNVSTRYELLMLLYEEELLDRLEELVIRAKIQAYEATRTYVLSLPC